MKEIMIQVEVLENGQTRINFIDMPTLSNGDVIVIYMDKGQYKAALQEDESAANALRQMMNK